MIDCERLDNWDVEEDEEEKDFAIVTDLMAEWGIKQIKKAEEERDRLVAIAKEEIADLERQIEIHTLRCENSTKYLKGKLQEYFNTVEHKETKTQESYKLLSGSLVWKKPAAKIKRPDDDKLLGILKDIDPLEMYIETIQKPKWAEFKKTLKLLDNGQIVDEDGDIIEGIEVEDVAGEFNIKF